MSGPLPARIDPHRAVAADERYRGDLSLSALPRLADMIEPDQQPGGGQVAYQLHFLRDASGRAVVQGSVQAQLRLRCQRCYEPFDLPVAATFTLALVAGLDEAAALPDDYDPLLVPAARGGGMIAPRDLIEDELILAIPVVPRHLDQTCPAVDGSAPPVTDRATGAEAAAAADGRPNPFAVLARLKRGE